jgi:hypothetical protein
MEAASMYIGFTVNDEDFNENFVETGKAIKLQNGKYFFPDFIEHQYPKGLQEQNAAHKNVIFELKKYSLLDDANCVKIKKKTIEFKAPSKPLFSSTGNGYGNGIGNEEGKGNGNGYTPNPIYPIPKMSIIWKKHNSTYAEDYKRDFTHLNNIWNFIKDQYKTEDESKILETFEHISSFTSTHDFFKNYSIKQVDTHIQSIFQNIKNGTDSKNKSGNNGLSREGIQAKLAARLKEREQT